MFLQRSSHSQEFVLFTQWFISRELSNHQQGHKETQHPRSRAFYLHFIWFHSFLPCLQIITVTNLKMTQCKGLFFNLNLELQPCSSSSGLDCLLDQCLHFSTCSKLPSPISAICYYIPFVSFSTCFWISMSTLKWTYVSSFLKATGVSCTGVRSIPFKSVRKKTAWGWERRCLQALLCCPDAVCVIPAGSRWAWTGLQLPAPATTDIPHEASAPRKTWGIKNQFTISRAGDRPLPHTLSDLLFCKPRGGDINRAPC